MAETDLLAWLDGIVRLLRRFPKEDAAIGALLILLLTERLHGFMGWPLISGYRREVCIGSGRCDLVLTHVDGSFTLLEAKAERDDTYVASAIGQLFLYQANFNSAGAPVRKALAVPGYGSASVVRACELAGVEFIPLGDLENRFAKYSAILANLRQNQHAQIQP